MKFYHVQRSSQAAKRVPVVSTLVIFNASSQGPFDCRPPDRGWRTVLRQVVDSWTLLNP